MRVVTVSRKPCEGTTTANAAAQGSGALAIGPCRVGSETITQHGRKAKAGTGWEDHWHNELQGGASWTGRWPSNLILVHRPGCEVVGERRVPTGTAVRRHVGHSTKGLISYAQGTRDAEMREDVTYADADGKEAVPDWLCEFSCPVAVLESIEGAVTGRRTARSQDATVTGTAWLADNHRSIEYANERGSVARFFKQVKP